MAFNFLYVHPNDGPILWNSDYFLTSAYICCEKAFRGENWVVMDEVQKFVTFLASATLPTHSASLLGAGD